MKMRNIAAVILTVVTLLPCLTGCGNNSQTDLSTDTKSRTEERKSAEAEKSTEAGKSTETPKKAVTVTIWSSEEHSKTVMERLVDEFNNGEGKELGIQFEYIVKDAASLSSAMEVALQTGQAPDIISGGPSLKKGIEMGYYAALSDLPGAEEYLKKYEGKLIEGDNIIDGKVYTVPTTISMVGLLYNKDMFRTAGLVDENGEPTPPTTFDEMREYAKILTNASKSQFGIIFPMKWSGWVNHDIQCVSQSSVGHFGWDPVNGKVDYTGLAPIINSYIGMIEDGSAYPGAEGMDNDTARALFAQGLIGMKIGMEFDVGVLNDQFPAECDWGVAPLPVVDKDNMYMQYCKWSGTPAVNAKSVEEKGEACLKYIEWYTSDDVIRELYANGLKMPIFYDVVKDTEMVEDIKGWTEFCAIAAISYPRQKVPNADMSGVLNLQERIINEVMSGKKTAETVLEEYTSDRTEGTKVYYQQHPGESLDDFMNPDYDIRRTD